MSSYEDIIRIVVWIKTIFEHFKNDSLEVSIWEDNKSMRVEYKNKQLAYFETIEGVDTKNYLNVIYSVPFDFHAYLSGKNKSKCKEKSIDSYEEKIMDIWKQISELENINLIRLNLKDKKICKIYKLFYGENPDFCREDISIRIQTMLCILVEFNISLGYDFDTKLLDNNLQYSMELECTIDKLTPFGEIDVDESIELKESSKRKIKIVGEFVRNYTKNDPNNLIKLSSIIWASRYNLSEIEEDKTIERIAEYSYSSRDTIKDNIKLVRKIKENIQKNKA